MTFARGLLFLMVLFLMCTMLYMAHLSIYILSSPLQVLLKNKASNSVLFMYLPTKIVVGMKNT